ncbi:hypothetical protein RUESEDTHA_03748 [Ruegeria sp. THAF57]|uniref:DUF1097 domain-containing protein n=1 Tax=Ruegeria sp. THAF57 TaxID=2744555 RepID=UPI0015DF5D93|nr:DUF1097 domain-containing protein [Ruegeria sp. THAF57]CAD0186837.1 hypothetical protein RUESEDTHA_03748 [Ruegeria sp. THAF57]
MKSLNALAISIPVTGAIATYLALGPLSGFFLIWAAFAVWGGFFAFGADGAAFKNIVVCGIFGCVIAWVSTLIILNVPLAGALGLPLWAAIVVNLGVAVAVLAAKTQLFSAIPCTVFGIASSYAYLLQTPDVMSTAVLTSASLENQIILMPLSIIAGAICGMISGTWGSAMTNEA